MSEILTRFVYGYVVTEAPNMRDAFDEISELSGEFEDLEFQSDVMYGDTPTRIMVGVNASPTYDNFEGVNISILNERIEKARERFDLIAPKLAERLKLMGCKISLPDLLIFNYED